MFLGSWTQVTSPSPLPQSITAALWLRPLLSVLTLSYKRTLVTPFRVYSQHQGEPPISGSSVSSHLKVHLTRKVPETQADTDAFGGLHSVTTQGIRTWACSGTFSPTVLCNSTRNVTPPCDLTTAGAEGGW